MQEDKSVEITFTHEGKLYKGWATPSPKRNKINEPRSWRVVLNNVFFGNLSKNASDNWVNDEDRPEALTEETGRQLNTINAEDDARLSDI